ncbi:arf-GAP with dual PH domain-containing protein 1 isoform X6 [Manis javanica]|uniref:arf-GAP with dual PH domain-containing protein 1 isoform X6 n=1 Tax=Manis javanica TaxID=9974 RepID=UPI003C6DA3D7
MATPPALLNPRPVLPDQDWPSGPLLCCQCPQPLSCSVSLLREQWIRAKYERREFTHPEKQEPYSAGWSKQGSAAPCWAPQAGQAGHQDPSSCFSQMLQEDAPGILGLMARISRGLSLEAWQGQRAVFKPEVCADGTRGGLEVFQQKRRQGAQGHHEDRASECHLPASQNRPPPRPAGHLPEGQQHPEYLCLPRGREASGPQEMVDWFNALRAARFHYLQVAFPGASDADLVPKLSRNYLKEGYMEKTGPKHTEGFRKRWFTMDDRRLMYFKDPLGAGDLAWLSPAPALRTPSPVGKSSSAAGSAATLCWTGSRHPRRATTGRMASRSSRQSAGSCWHVRLSQSGGRGQQLFGRLWTGPCCPRNMQWKPTSSINRSRAGPGGPRNPDSCDLASEDTAARLWRPTARGGWPPGPCPEGQPQSGAAGT